MKNFSFYSVGEVSRRNLENQWTEKLQEHETCRKTAQKFDRRMENEEFDTACDSENYSNHLKSNCVILTNCIVYMAEKLRKERKISTNWAVLDMIWLELKLFNVNCNAFQMADKTLKRNVRQYVCVQHQTFSTYICINKSNSRLWRLKRQPIESEREKMNKMRKKGEVWN